MQSEEYRNLQLSIENAQALQKSMLSNVPDSSVEYATLKRQVIAEFQSKGIEKHGNVVAQFKERKEVNTRRVLDVLAGDVGLFMELATVQQTKLKDFAKSNPNIKKELTECIEVVAREITDLSILAA